MASKIGGISPQSFPKTPDDALALAQRLSKSVDEQTLQLLKLLGTVEGDEVLKQPQLPTLRPGELPPMIRAYDSHGRKLEIPRENWKHAVLEPALKQNASNPEALRRVIVQALEDGFIEESLIPAQQLVKIDPSPLRSVPLLGSVLVQLKRFDEALEVMEPAAQKYGETAEILTKVARAFAGLGKADKSEEVLWRALVLDPNHEEALEWYVAIARERGGAAGQQAAYQRVAALPASWLAQSWLAGDALEAQDVDGAIRLYKDILGKLPNIPEGVLVRISADLTRHGALRQMLDLVEPYFDASKHGLLLGASLIAAHLELNDAPAARHIFDLLYGLQRPDWRDHLVMWRKRIDEAEQGPMQQPKPLGFELLRLGNPIWAYGDPDFEALLPPKAAAASRIVLVCGSGSFGASASDPIAKPTDALGRLTRFIPMFFAEELQLQTAMQSIVLLPWIPNGGFASSTRPWQREQLKLEELNASFVLAMHVDAHRRPWNMQFTLTASADRFVLDTWTQPVDVRSLASAADASLKRIFETLSLVNREAVSEALAAPEGAKLNAYLVAIEQALTIVTNNMESADNAPQVKQVMLDNLLRFAADTPRSARTRCLLVNALHREALRQPDVAANYWQGLQELQNEHPLEWGPAAIAVDVAIDKLGAQLKLR